jgi:tRNA modification GTPase
MPTALTTPRETSRDPEPEKGAAMSLAAWFRVLTAESRGAIAVIRVWGREAVKVVDSVFRPHQGPALSQTAPGRLRLGRAGIGLGDEVVAVRIEATIPIVELQCHGGAAAVAAVVGALVAAGAIPGNGHPEIVADRLRAQAMEDLALAPTLKVAEDMLDQVHGAFRRSLECLIAGAEGTAAPVLAELEALIGAGEFGVRLLQGWKVAIAGRPNVGKSRLFNALAGFERSIVNPRPGVTRDVVSVRTAFGGWPVELSDTAGERATADAIEELGIRRSQQERSEANLVLLVLDRSEPLHEIDLALLSSNPSALVVANKCDLPPAWQTAPIGGTDRPVPAVSAETGEGLFDLIVTLASRLVPEPPEPGATIPFRPEHILRLQAARDHLLVGDHDGCTQSLRGIMD